MVKVPAALTLVPVKLKFQVTGAAYAAPDRANMAAAPAQIFNALMGLLFWSIKGSGSNSKSCAATKLLKKRIRNKDLVRFGVFREVQGVKNADICVRGIDTAPRRARGAALPQTGAKGSFRAARWVTALGRQRQFG